MGTWAHRRLLTLVPSGHCIVASSEWPLLPKEELQKGCEETKHPASPVCSALTFTTAALTHRLDFEASHSSLDFSSDVEDSHLSTGSVAAPVTLISPQASPQHPSDILKIHCCTYEDCGKSFNRPAKLVQHLRSHTNTRPFLCPHSLCTKDFLRESHLKHHVKSAHSDVRDYVCEWEGCGKRFVTATRLKRHHATHESREKFRCSILGCGQSFRKHGTLQNHVIVVHEGRKPFVCEISDLDGMKCGAGFDYKAQLKAHTRRAHELKIFLCTICPPKCRSIIGNSVSEKAHVAFSTSTALRQHIEIEHAQTRTDCGEDCNSLRGFDSHLGLLHSMDINDSKACVCHERGCEPDFMEKGILSMNVQLSNSPTSFIGDGMDPTTLSQVANCDGMNSFKKALKTNFSPKGNVLTTHRGFVPSCKHQTRRGTFDESARQYQNCVLTRLTGAGYEEENGRDISCLVIGCNHRFLRKYDREIHLQSCHGLAGIDVQEVLIDQRELHGRPTLQGIQSFATKQDIDIENVLDIDYSDDVGRIGKETFLGAGLFKCGDFWIDEESYQDRVISGEWVRDELEMRYLIDDGL